MINKYIAKVEPEHPYSIYTEEETNMTWNWSHTQEAYDNVYYNISQLSLETLREIATEIKTYQDMLAQRPERLIEGLSDREILWHPELHEMYLEKVNNLPADILVDLIYKFASEQAECTNGGYEAYVCPYGCHSVSFSRDSIRDNTKQVL